MLVLVLLLVLLRSRRRWVLRDGSRRCSRTAWSQVCSWFDMHLLDGATCVSLVVVGAVVVVVLGIVVTVAEAPCRLQGRVRMGLIRSLQHGPTLC